MGLSASISVSTSDNRDNLAIVFLAVEERSFPGYRKLLSTKYSFVSVVVMEKRKETLAEVSLMLIKFLLPRGSFAYNANVIASSIVDLPLPVGPKIPKNP